MADKDEDIEVQDDLLHVEIDEAPETEVKEGKQPEQTKASAEEISPDDATAELRRQLDEERAARRAEAERATQAERSAIEAQTQIGDSRIQQFDTAIQLRTTRLQQLRSQIADANRDGDWEKAAQLTEEMTDLKVDIRTIERGKATLETQIREYQERVQQPVQREPQSVEDWKPHLSPQAYDWLQKHPECATDAQQRALMMAGHNLALAKGVRPDTPEYFAVIDETLDGASKPAAQAAAQQAPRPKPIPAAPARQDAPAAGKTRVTLTRDERNIAEALGMTAEAYARNKLKLQKAGG